MIDRIQWLGHGSFIIQGPPLIYIDPWRVVRSVFHADVILISHEHYDHCSPADIEKLRGPNTVIIGNETVAKEIEDCVVLRPWQTMTVDKAAIKAVPAYALDDLRHPKESGGLGFVVSVNHYDIYYAGDTGRIPEMDFIKADIAILPIDGAGTLNVVEATQVVQKIKPRWVLPGNWGTLPDGATAFDAQALKDSVGEAAQVVIPSQVR